MHAFQSPIKGTVSKTKEDKSLGNPFRRSFHHRNLVRVASVLGNTDCVSESPGVLMKTQTPGAQPQSF